ncbi:MAG: NAD(P)-dependent oxidoreductase [Sphingobacteriales bacterium]|nr:MAG: NAD(P)-dependent oxidoreductase [Sphingobacteriales bacterium]
MLVLVTGATGKVGQVFIERILKEPKWPDAKVRALCHNRMMQPRNRLEIVQGSISDRDVVDRAMSGVTHVIHMATVKEDPLSAMDVSVKGMFWLLEAFRASPTAEQFMLIGGDCVVGHIIMPYDAPITEESPRRPYPGVYALSKVLEEVMLEQYYVQYGINGCCLRAPWIMEKDDFRYALSFGADQFGGPGWDALLSPAERTRHHASGAVPLMIDAQGHSLKRNFVHVDDLVAAVLAALDNPAARQQLFNIAMNRPLDYAAVAERLLQTRGLPSVRIETPYHSNWLDNTKARHLLEWEPKVDTEQLVDRAFAYVRAPDDPRHVWYVG